MGKEKPAKSTDKAPEEKHVPKTSPRAAFKSIYHHTPHFTSSIPKLPSKLRHSTSAEDLCDRPETSNQPPMNQNSKVAQADSSVGSPTTNTFDVKGYSDETLQRVLEEYLNARLGTDDEPEASSKRGS